MVVGGTRCSGWGAGVGATFRMCSTFTVSPITARCLRGPRVRAGQCPPPTCRPPTPPPPTKPDMPPPADEVPQPGSQAAVEEPRVEGLLQRRRCLHGVPARGNGHGSHQPRCVSHPRQVVQHLHPAGEGGRDWGGLSCATPRLSPPPFSAIPSHGYTGGQQRGVRVPAVDVRDGRLQVLGVAGTEGPGSLGEAEPSGAPQCPAMGQRPG